MISNQGTSKNHVIRARPSDSAIEARQQNSEGMGGIKLEKGRVNNIEGLFIK